jgi:hypothetical protein
VGRAAMEAAARADELKALANRAVAHADFAGAVKHLSEAIELRPNLKELWSNRAFAFSSLGRHADALADAQHCMKIAPGFSKGHLRAGRALISLGRFDDAVDLLEDAVDAMPQDYALQEALADAVAGGASAGASSAGASVPPGRPAASQTHASHPAAGGGLDSSYYYAAVPASQRKLPVAPPQRIDGDGATAKAVASGAIREDIARKGGLHAPSAPPPRAHAPTPLVRVRRPQGRTRTTMLTIGRRTLSCRRCRRSSTRTAASRRGMASDEPPHPPLGADAAPSHGAHPIVPRPPNQLAKTSAKT